MTATHQTFPSLVILNSFQDPYVKSKVAGKTMILEMRLA